MRVPLDITRRNGAANLLRLSRVEDWRGYLGMALLGLFLNGVPSDPLDTAIFMLIVSFYLAFAFSVNNCFDVVVDLLDVKDLNKNPVASGLLAFESAIAFSLAFLVAGMVLSYSFFGIRSTLLFSLLYLLAGLYSVPPVRIKSRPYFDLLSHGLFFGGLLILAGPTTFGRLTPVTLGIAVVLFFYSMFLEIRNHIDDYEFDKLSGTRTTVVHLGLEASERLKRALALITIISLYVILIATSNLVTLLITTITLSLLVLLGLSEDRTVDFTVVASMLFLLLEQSNLIVV
ncbi:MAG: 4-hydroxybenzoate polyprenyltransferase [Thermoproteota archaeon]|nr:MAG: 4-hydroxybenzoate polyprenyltransferase [Candidatus Korarchaeota archaeon]